MGLIFLPKLWYQHKQVCNHGLQFVSTIMFLFLFHFSSHALTLSAFLAITKSIFVIRVMHRLSICDVNHHPFYISYITWTMNEHIESCSFVMDFDNRNKASLCRCQASFASAWAYVCGCRAIKSHISIFMHTNSTSICYIYGNALITQNVCWQGAHDSSHHGGAYAGIYLGDPDIGTTTISEMSPEDIRAELKRYFFMCSMFIRSLLFIFLVESFDRLRSFFIWLHSSCFFLSLFLCVPFSHLISGVH